MANKVEFGISNLYVGTYSVGTTGTVTMGTPYHQAGIVFEEGEDQGKTIVQASHHMFLASAKAVIAGHRIDPENKIGMMVAYAPTYPLTCKPDDVMASIEAMRARNCAASRRWCRATSGRHRKAASGRPPGSKWFPPSASRASASSPISARTIARSCASR